MNKIEFIKKIAEKTGQSQDATNKFINAFVETVVSEVRDNGEQIALNGLGTFKQKQNKARDGRNPFNGEKISIPASRTIAFKVQTTLKVEEKTAKKKK